MLAKSAHFLEMYILLRVIVAATSVTSASSAFLASFALKIEFMILNTHIYFYMF